MKGEYFSYHIHTIVKPNDRRLTNYSHFNDPTPQMHIPAKKICICLLFYFNWHMLNGQLKSSKLFVANLLQFSFLASLFIIYNSMRIQNYCFFGKVKALLKIAH